MGQYYRVITQKDDEITVYNRYLIIKGKREYTMAKLMEHSWFENPFVETVCNLLLNEPKNIAWIGDYASQCLQDDEIVNNLHHSTLSELASITWDEPDCSKDLQQEDFDSTKYFLVNHSKKQYVNLSAYYNRCKVNHYDSDWCIHPLPLLTCIGNGLGGGDYLSPTVDSTINLVGAWAWDIISLEKVTPSDYKEIHPTFKETYWE